tara:strand:- start:3125 stop:3793 length:669 start_codon:yes stop_codon:yes gene_type:complete
MTPLWSEKISILYEKRYIFEVLPSKKFDFNRKLNSLLRLSIYYSLIMFFLDRTNTNVMYIPLIVAAITFTLKKFYKPTNIKNLEIPSTEYSDINKEINNLNPLNEGCRIPTKNNPFMNPPLFGDRTTEACSSYNQKSIQRDIEKNFNEDLYRDANDIFGKNNSQRQFYSVPGKSIPNDQEAFANWLYSTPPTCKEGNGIQCTALSAEYRGTGVGLAQGPSGP